MKTNISSVLLITFLALVLPAAAQNSPRRQVTPPPATGVPQPPMMPSSGGRSQHQTGPELPHNVKLTLEGSLFGTIPTDFSVTTGGTTVSSDMTLESKEPAPTVGSFQANLTPGEPWLVVINIGARVPVPAGNGNIQYQDSRLNTTVRIVPGKKVVLWEKGGQKLTLSMEKVED